MKRRHLYALASAVIALSMVSCSAPSSSIISSDSPSISSAGQWTPPSSSAEQNPWPGDNPGQDPWQGGGNNGGTNQGGNNEGQNQGGDNWSNEQENDVDFQEYSTLPVIKIVTETDESGQNKAIDSLETYTTCSVSLDNCDDSYKKSDMTGGIRLRGNSTNSFVKKPYRIKFDSKQSMFGLNDGAKCKSWVLLAEFNDYSYMHNYYTYHLGNKLSGIGFSPDSMFTEVYINGKYHGIYLLSEQIQVNKNRINISESGVNDSSITDTGYLLEMESVADRRTEEGNENEAWFKVDGYAQDNHAERVWDSSVAYYVIKSDAKSTSQVQFIKNYMKEVYDAIYKRDDSKITITIGDTDYESGTEECISALIDVDSAVDMYILQLLANDYDNNYSSVYVYKDAGGKLQFGPPWDFDLAYGSFSEHKETDSVYMYHLLSTLYDYDWFKDEVKQRYAAVSVSDGILDQVMAECDEQITLHYDDFMNREYQKWRRTQDGYHCFGPSYSSQKEAMDYFKSWLSQRESWITNTKLK